MRDEFAFAFAEASGAVAREAPISNRSDCIARMRAFLAQSTPEEILRTVVNYEIDTDSLLVRPTEGESPLDDAIIEALTSRELTQSRDEFIS